MTYKIKQLTLKISNDQYVKSGTRLTRGKGDVFQEAHTKEGSPKNKKKHLIKLVCSYFQTNEDRNLFEIPLVVNSGKQIWRVTKEKTVKSFKHQTMKKLTQG